MDDFMNQALNVGDWVVFVMVGNGHLRLGKILRIGEKRATVNVTETINGKIYSNDFVVLPTNLVKVEGLDVTLRILKGNS